MSNDIYKFQGKDITVQNLKQHYSGLIFAYGAGGLIIIFLFFLICFLFNYFCFIYKRGKKIRN